MTSLQYLFRKTILGKTHVWALAASDIKIPGVYRSRYISVYGTAEDGVVSRRIPNLRDLRKTFRAKVKKGYVISHDSAVLNQVTQQLEKHDCWEQLAGPFFDKFKP